MPTENRDVLDWIKQRARADAPLQAAAKSRTSADLQPRTITARRC